MKLLITALSFFIVTSAYAERIVVYAAASTASPVQEILTEFSEETGIKTAASFASSGTLAKQIANSAPADIFISANSRWLQWLKNNKLLKDSTVKPLLANRLALISHKYKGETFTQMQITELLTSGGRIAMADPSHAPAGRYAEETLKSLGILKETEKRLIKMQTVRVALAMVERRAVPFAIVYASDAVSSDTISILTLFNENLHGAIRYPYSIVNGKDTPNVVKLYSFLQSAKALSIFEKYGFQRAD